MEVASVPGQPAAPAAAPAPGQPAVAPQSPQPGQPGTDPSQVQPQAPEQAQPAGPDPFLNSRLGEMGDTMRQLLERIPAPQPEPEPNWAEQLEQLYDPTTGVPDPQQLEGYITQRAEAIAEQRVAAVRGELGEIKQTLSNQQIDALTDKYPQMQDPQYGLQVIERAAQQAEALARVVGREVPLTADLIEMSHFAIAGEAAARGETPAPGPGPAAQLETGGGGAPAPATGEQSEWERIKNAGGGTSTAIF